MMLIRQIKLTNAFFIEWFMATFEVTVLTGVSFSVIHDQFDFMGLAVLFPAYQVDTSSKIIRECDCNSLSLTSCAFDITGDTQISAVWR